MASPNHNRSFPTVNDPRPMVEGECCTHAAASAIADGVAPMRALAFNVPNILFSIKSLRQNQPRGVAFLLHCLKHNPECTVTASTFADAVELTPRGARLMLYRLEQLGYGKVEVRTYTRISLPTKIKYAWAEGQTYFKVLHFRPLVDAFKKLFGNFLKTHSSPILLNNNESVLRSTQVLILAARRPNLSREQKRELIVKFIKAGRNDLWDYFACWWDKQDNEPKYRKYCEERGVPPSQIDRLLEQLFPSKWEPSDSTSVSQSVLDFFISPRIESASEELERVAATMEDLNSQRDLWTDKQRRFWFSLKSKQTRLCKYIKEMLFSVVRYEEFIGAPSL